MENAILPTQTEQEVLSLGFLVSNFTREIWVWTATVNRLIRTSVCNKDVHMAKQDRIDERYVRITQQGANLFRQCLSFSAHMSEHVTWKRQLVSLSSIWLPFSAVASLRLCFSLLLSRYMGQHLFHTFVWIIKKAAMSYSLIWTRSMEGSVVCDSKVI